MKKRSLRYFPYTPRKGQEDAIEYIRNSIKNGYKHIMFQAATGFGKTPVVLAALLPHIKKGCRVLWIVRTGNEADRPIEELRIIARRIGKSVFGFSFRGKSDMCLLARELFTHAGYEEATYICSRLRKKCKYYLNYLSGRVDVDLIVSEPRLYSELLEYGRAYNICPYMLQYLLLKKAKVVALSYNYVLRESISRALKYRINFKNTILVVDEAHNLQHINLYSDRITLRTISNAIKECEENDLKSLKRELQLFEERIIEFYKDLLRKRVEDYVFSLNEFEPYINYMFLEEALREGENIRRKQLEEGKRPRSSLYRFARFWLSALELEEMEGITFVATPNRDNLILEIWDMRSGEVLSSVWQQFKAVIFMSGTLKPIDAFAETVGLNGYVEKVIPSHYPRNNIKSIVIKGLTTRGETLSNDMRERYIEAIESFVREVDANIAIFTSSYRVQEELFERGLIEALRNYGRTFVEKRTLRGDEARKMLEEFKESYKRHEKGILISPMGGRFAEGADFPGKELEAIFLVGVPFDRITAKTREYIRYYEKIYGVQKGRFYAYVVPALRRAAQAMGRALRSAEDRAVIVAADERYAKYINLLPDYFAETVTYKSLEEFLGEVEELGKFLK